ACNAQRLLRPRSPDSPVALPPVYDAELYSQEERADLPCMVKNNKPELRLALRFHTGYPVKLKLDGMERSENLLTIIFRVRASTGSDAVYMRDEIRVPATKEEREGVFRQKTAFDIGEGNYHVDWMMHDYVQRVCSA